MEDTCADVSTVHNKVTSVDEKVTETTKSDIEYTWAGVATVHETARETYNPDVEDSCDQHHTCADISPDSDIPNRVPYT